MNEESMRMAELSLQGFGCSQILIILALEAEGKTSPELVRAISGLHGGLASGKLCGALSGGACALALRRGRADPREAEDPRLPLLVQQLVEWFEHEYGERAGGIDCDAILAGDPRNKRSVCPRLIGAVSEKVKALLAAETP
jgi:C_GCAxxG_C_C family probable redox protein